MLARETEIEKRRKRMGQGPPIFSFFPKMVLGIQGLLCFSTSLSFIYSRSVKK